MKNVKNTTDEELKNFDYKALEEKIYPKRGNLDNKSFTKIT